MSLQKLHNSISANPVLLFKLDAYGALLSFALYGVLAWYEDFAGMPREVMYRLQFLAGIYCLYSSVCFIVKPRTWSIFLSIIAAANVCHCVIASYFLLVHSETLTLLGWMYFIGEILIVLVIAQYEWKIARGGLASDN